MKRAILSLAMFALLAAGMVGCRASASVDPHSATMFTPAQ
jgi:hypothetical protein